MRYTSPPPLPVFSLRSLLFSGLYLVPLTLRAAWVHSRAGLNLVFHLFLHLSISSNYCLYTILY